MTIQITTRDTRTENHEIIKRPLNGKRRKEVQKELKNEGSSEKKTKVTKKTGKGDYTRRRNRTTDIAQ